MTTDTTPEWAAKAAREIRNLVFGCNGCDHPEDGGECGNNTIDFCCEGAVEHFTAIITQCAEQEDVDGKPLFADPPPGYECRD